MRPSLITISLLITAGCADFPDLRETIGPAARQAPYPELVPVETLMSQVTEAAITPDFEAGLAARIAALRARAARLRGTVLDDPSRTRLTSGITTR